MERDRKNITQIEAIEEFGRMKIEALIDWLDQQEDGAFKDAAFEELVNFQEQWPNLLEQKSILRLCRLIDQRLGVLEATGESEEELLIELKGLIQKIRRDFGEQFGNLAQTEAEAMKQARGQFLAEVKKEVAAKLPALLDTIEGLELNDEEADELKNLLRAVEVYFSVFLNRHSSDLDGFYTLFWSHFEEFRLASDRLAAAFKGVVQTPVLECLINIDTDEQSAAFESKAEAEYNPAAFEACVDALVPRHIERRSNPDEAEALKEIFWATQKRIGNQPFKEQEKMLSVCVVGFCKAMNRTLKRLAQESQGTKLTRTAYSFLNRGHRFVFVTSLSKPILEQALRTYLSKLKQGGVPQDNTWLLKTARIFIGCALGIRHQGMERQFRKYPDLENIFIRELEAIRHDEAIDFGVSLEAMVYENIEAFVSALEQKGEVLDESPSTEAPFGGQPEEDEAGEANEVEMPELGNIEGEGIEEEDINIEPRQNEGVEPTPPSPEAPSEVVNPLEELRPAPLSEAESSVLDKITAALTAQWEEVKREVDAFRIAVALLENRRAHIEALRKNHEHLHGNQSAIDALCSEVETVHAKVGSLKEMVIAAVDTMNELKLAVLAASYSKDNEEVQRFYKAHQRLESFGAEIHEIHGSIERQYAQLDQFYQQLEKGHRVLKRIEKSYPKTGFSALLTTEEEYLAKPNHETQRKLGRLLGLANEIKSILREIEEQRTKLPHPLLEEISRIFEKEKEVIAPEAIIPQRESEDRASENKERIELSPASLRAIQILAALARIKNHYKTLGIFPSTLARYVKAVFPEFQSHDKEELEYAIAKELDSVATRDKSSKIRVSNEVKEAYSDSPLITFRSRGDKGWVYVSTRSSDSFVGRHGIPPLTSQEEGRLKHSYAQHQSKKETRKRRPKKS